MHGENPSSWAVLALLNRMHFLQEIKNMKPRNHVVLALLRNPKRNQGKHRSKTKHQVLMKSLHRKGEL
jgi:hypothetical protein